MALTHQQLVDVRRYMGYSVTGDSTSTPYRELAYSAVSYMGLSLDYRLQHLTSREETTLVNSYLTPLAQREQDIQDASSNLDTDEAAVWKRNPKEIADRINLYTWLRRELCNFLGFKPGPLLAAGNSVVRA